MPFPAGVSRLVGDGLLWHRPPPFRRSAAYAAAAVLAVALAGQWAFVLDGEVLTDGHAIVSLDLAIARAYCGHPSSYSPAVRIPVELSGGMERRHVPLRALITARAGSIDAYCGSVGQPIVNSENSLMLLETAILRMLPGLSLSQLGQILHLIRIACLAVFVLLLMDLGGSIAFGVATFLCGLVVLQAMPDFVYSNYPFFFVLVLGAVAFHLFAVKYRWTDRAAGLVLYGSFAGVLSAFIANMRTSYLPAAVLFFTCVLIEELRPRRDAVSWRARGVRAAALAALFVAGFSAFQTGLITRHLPAEGRYNAAHPVGHPLVLALAVPDNPFSRAMGIQWADEAGPRIAQRVDPGVTFLGPRYNAAMIQFYTTLWQTHTREMFALYYLKFSVAGSDMLAVLRSSPGPAGWALRVLLTPLAALPSGVWLLALYGSVAAGSFVRYYRRNTAAALALALLSLAACLVQLESALIYSTYVKQYHNYAAFYALFVSLVAGQALVNAGWALARRRAMRTDPA